MATPALGDGEFLLGYCAACEKYVLTHIDLGPHDQEIRRCLHCDETIAHDLKPVGPAELEASGYAVVSARTCGNGGGCGAEGGCGLRARS